LRAFVEEMEEETSIYMRHFALQFSKI